MTTEPTADALPTPPTPASAPADTVAPPTSSAPTRPDAAPASRLLLPPSTPVAVPTGLRFALGGLAVVAVAALALAWQGQRNARGLEQELVRRQQDAAAQVAEAKAVAKSAQDVAREAQAKVAVLDTRLSEVALQRTQLEELMQSLSRARDENLVNDIDAAVRVALQQVAITGSAEPLVAALRSAEERLSRVSATQPRLDSVRRAIARDLDRVRAVGVADMGALLIKLDECIRLIDELPLINGSAARSSPAAAAVAPARPASAPAGWFDGGVRWLDVVWTEVRSLVRVTRIDQPESMLVAPDQSFLLRENLKLRLLNARLALLSRQAESAQGDLQNAASVITRYFDGSSRRTQIALDLVRAVATQARQTTLPRPDETLAALNTAAAGR